MRVERAHDLRLCHAILRRSARCAGSALATAPDGPWDAPAPRAPVGAWVGTARGPGPPPATLFDDVPASPARAGDVDASADTGASGPTAPGASGPPVSGPSGPPDAAEELRRQLDAVARSDQPGRLRLLLAAESTGALLAAEMHHDGLPWDAEVHDALLTELLGPRPRGGSRPARLEALADEVRHLLDQPRLNPDSQQDLLRGLRLAGLPVTTTSKHALAAVDHAVVGPLLEYKRLARLLSANGWAWMEQWVRDGRFRPDYVPAGVVTGRWATSGGGALQLPAAVRAAVRADPGWRLVVADAAQLEPRVLAAMSGDRAMTTAARGADLYQGLVDAGVVGSRTDAKYAMLGAIYGATTGTGGALMPRLRRAYPAAIELVDEAARAGERGEPATTWLGRTSPGAGERWRDLRDAATQEGADAVVVGEARRRARDRGRFTRNFVVQGTAAEWALCWLAALRRRLRDLPGRPHLVLFLHDEVVVHAPAEVTDDVVVAVRDAADEAGRLLFGSWPVDFALDVAVVESYDRA